MVPHVKKKDKAMTVFELAVGQSSLFAKSGS